MYDSKMGEVLNDPLLCAKIIKTGSSTVVDIPRCESGILTWYSLLASTSARFIPVSSVVLQVPQADARTFSMIYQY